MKFEVGKLYKHMNSLDIEILVGSIWYTKKEEAVMTIHYWNPGFNTFQGESARITISKEDSDKWVEVPNERN